MRRIFGIGAAIGFALALALALAGCVGFHIPSTWTARLAVFAMIEFACAFVSIFIAARSHPPFMLPREVSAGFLGIVLVLVLATVAPGRLHQGRPAEREGSYVVEDQSGAVLRALSRDEYRAALTAEERVGCAVMALFLYVPVLRFLVPPRVWSAERPRRRGDVYGVADVSP